MSNKFEPIHAGNVTIYTSLNLAEFWREVYRNAIRAGRNSVEACRIADVALYDFRARAS